MGCTKLTGAKQRTACDIEQKGVELDAEGVLGPLRDLLSVV
jgi:hypothetical protein